MGDASRSDGSGSAIRPRYVVVDGPDLKDLDPSAWQFHYGGKWDDPCDCCLYDTVGRAVIYQDSNDAPEDKYLHRDLRVFVDLMNDQAARIAELEAAA